MLKFTLLVIFFLGTLSQEFTWFEGIRADPCAKYLIPRAAGDPRADCPENSQLPASAVTVWIPSAASSITQTTPSHLDGRLYQRVFKLQGKGLPLRPNLATVVSSSLRLGLDGSCQSTLAASNIVANTVLDNYGERLEFQLPNPCNDKDGWCDERFEILDRPLALCWSPDASSPTNFRYTGFMIGVVLNCDSQITLTQSVACTAANLASHRSRWAALHPMTPLQLESRVQRTSCCKSLNSETLKVGKCVNPKIEGCCGAVSYDLTTEKCCSQDTYNWVVSIDQACPCVTSDQCPINEKCCLPTKYTELVTATTTDRCPYLFSNPTSETHQCANGRCYNPERYRCCDTGSVYDYGVDQCCPINGVQSLNVPCPCSTDSHCSTLSSEHFCCKQTGPSQLVETETCNAYQNYPTGTGAYEVQRCSGFCYDAKYAVCCNGVSCIKEYERCCNSTCCNRFTGTCIEGLRPGAYGSQSNPLAPEIFQQCSTIEAVNTVKAFWIWAFPAMLLLATLSSLALSIIFSSKATPRSFSILEYAMILIAVIATFLSCPFFFAPIYKYGIFLVLVQMVVILTASARIKWLNIMCILVQIVAFIYVFDPFYGNAFFNLSSDRYVRTTNHDVIDRSSDKMTSGILHAVVKSWHTIKQVDEDNYCTAFYDWFKLDPMLRDTERVDNPEIKTFGYCSRGWVSALWFFAGLVMICTIIQLFLSLMGLFFRFHRDKIELEVHEELVY